MKWIAVLAIVGGLVVAVAHAADPGVKPSAAFVRPFPMVATARGASDARKVAAKEVAAAIGVSTFSELERNPVCCIWIEVTGWVPNPGEPGYFIINQGGGSIISASDDEQLRKAVERFRKS